jgi:hypothetical protein
MFIQKSELVNENKITFKCIREKWKELTQRKYGNGVVCARAISNSVVFFNFRSLLFFFNLFVSLHNYSTFWFRVRKFRKIKKNSALVKKLKFYKFSLLYPHLESSDIFFLFYMSTSFSLSGFLAIDILYF